METPSKNRLYGNQYEVNGGVISRRAASLFNAYVIDCLANGVKLVGDFDVTVLWDAAIWTAREELDIQSYIPARERCAPGMEQWFELFPPAVAS